jgi:hypothetical protein
MFGWLPWCRLTPKKEVPWAKAQEVNESVQVLAQIELLKKMMRGEFEALWGRIEEMEKKLLEQNEAVNHALLSLFIRPANKVIYGASDSADGPVLWPKEVVERVEEIGGGTPMTPEEEGKFWIKEAHASGGSVNDD